MSFIINELLRCDKLQSLVPIYGFEDIKKGLISRLKKARKYVHAWLYFAVYI